MRTLLIPALVLAACSGPSEDTANAPASAPVNTSGNECGASGYQDLVGRNIAAVSMPADLDARMIEPGTVVTMDHRADRLNIEVNETGEIVRVFCG